MTEWKIFLDLQCPYSKVFWERLPSIQERFGSKYIFTRHITSLLFHPQAFDAHCAVHCAVTLVGNVRGMEIRRKYEDALFENQESYWTRHLVMPRNQRLWQYLPILLRRWMVYLMSLLQETTLSRKSKTGSCVSNQHMKNTKLLSDITRMGRQSMW